MTKRQFIKQRKPAWRRFDALIGGAAGRGLRRLRGKEITEYSRLLREISHDLAVVRARGWDLRLETYLNDLASRGYNRFYQAPPGTTNKIIHYFTTHFPRVLRRNWKYSLVGCALFFIPFFLSWGLVVANPDLVHRIVPGDQLEMADESYGQDDPYEEIGLTPQYFEERTAAFGFYIFNNVGIGLRTLALGLTFGVGTVKDLLFNGIFIGATFGYIQNQGNGDRLFSFVISHGSFELTAIGIAGGAGLIIADALLHPGNRTRIEALMDRGLDAVQVAGGAAGMLVVAAVFEAYWSPAPIPAVFKYVVGTVLWLLVFAYLAFAGRGEEERERRGSGGDGG